MSEVKKEFLEQVAELFENARKSAKASVNLTMVYTYYEIGKRIVEEEQNGAGRAEYGKHLLAELSEYLTKEFGKGFSADNLKLMRRFYTVYSHDQIGETVFPQFSSLPAVDTGRRFYLSWSHYLKLMRIENTDERHFYEIEAAKNDWSLSEMKRQFDSALFERLALSKDKDEVKRLAQSGQIIEAPSDAVKDPYVLEFPDPRHGGVCRGGGAHRGHGKLRRQALRPGGGREQAVVHGAEAVRRGTFLYLRSRRGTFQHCQGPNQRVMLQFTVGKEVHDGKTDF